MYKTIDLNTENFEIDKNYNLYIRNACLTLTDCNNNPYVCTVPCTIHIDNLESMTDVINILNNYNIDMPAEYYYEGKDYYCANCGGFYTTNKKHQDYAEYAPYKQKHCKPYCPTCYEKIK